MRGNVKMWKCEKGCEKFAKHNLFIVSLQSRSVIGSHRWRAHKRDVRDGREMVALRFRQRCYMNWDAKHGSIRLTTVANVQPKKKMIAELIIPIETLRGKLRKDGYYFRMYKGKQIVQRCPNRKGHVKTEAEQANQERFVERYRKKKVGQQLRWSWVVNNLSF